MSSGSAWDTYDPVTKKVSKVKQKSMLFLFSNPIRSYHNDELWGDFLYRKITQKFIIHELMNIPDQRGFNGTRLKKCISQSRVYKFHHK